MSRRFAIVGLALLLAGCAPGGGAAGASPAPISTPTPMPSPTPITTPIAVPDGTPLIFFRDAIDFDQVDGMTWDGVVGAAGGVPDYHTANHAATLFGTANEILDRSGEVRNRGTFGLKGFQATWGDDDGHYCLIEPFDPLADGVPAILRIGSVEGGISTIMQVGNVHQQVSTYVAACSIVADRAIVVQSGGQGVGVAQYWVVRPSTRTVLWTHQFGPSVAPISIVASHDGKYVGENFDAGNGAQKSRVLDASGSELKQFDGAVLAFSWDDATVVLGAGMNGKAPAVARLAAPGTVWTLQAKPGDFVWDALAEPNGGRLAVAIGNPQTSFASSNTDGLPMVDVYVIASNGAVVKVLKSVYW